jgi:hypothetical protein
MSAKRWAHDFSWAISFELISSLRPLIPEEKIVEIFQQTQARLTNAIEGAITAYLRECERLHPVEKS